MKPEHVKLDRGWTNWQFWTTQKERLKPPQVWLWECWDREDVLTLKQTEEAKDTSPYSLKKALTYTRGATSHRHTDRSCNSTNRAHTHWTELVSGLISLLEMGCEGWKDAGRAVRRESAEPFCLMCVFCFTVMSVDTCLLTPATCRHQPNHQSVKH